jgi:hypothetical protein
MVNFVSIYIFFFWKSGSERREAAAVDVTCRIHVQYIDYRCAAAIWQQMSYSWHRKVQFDLLLRFAEPTQPSDSSGFSLTLLFIHPSHALHLLYFILLFHPQTRHPSTYALKSTNFLDVTQYKLVQIYQSFGETFCLLFQAQRLNEVSNKYTASCT